MKSPQVFRDDSVRLGTVYYLTGYVKAYTFRVGEQMVGDPRPGIYASTADPRTDEELRQAVAKWRDS